MRDDERCRIDQRLAAQVADQLRAQLPSADTSDVHITALRGTIRLSGLAPTPEARPAVADAVAAVPGVQAVQNDLYVGEA